MKNIIARKSTYPGLQFFFLSRLTLNYGNPKIVPGDLSQQLHLVFLLTSCRLDSHLPSQGFPHSNKFSLVKTYYILAVLFIFNSFQSKILIPSLDNNFIFYLDFIFNVQNCFKICFLSQVLHSKKYNTKIQCILRLQEITKHQTYENNTNILHLF